MENPIQHLSNPLAGHSEKGYLLDTCLSAQDRYEAQVEYFFPDLTGKGADIKDE